MDPPSYTLDTSPSIQHSNSSQSSNATNSAPITLAWSQDLHEPLARTSSQFLDTNPPAYAAMRTFTHPVTYSFSQTSFNSMILSPPIDAPDARPPYHISVSMNCFMPMSYITTIRRGTADGRIVGDFEMGIVDQPALVCIRGREIQLKKMLMKSTTGGHDQMWTWHVNDPILGLLWDCIGGRREWVCYRGSNRGLVVAKFRSLRSLRCPGLQPESKELEIYPEGHALFDDILISCLILERKRLTPDDHYKKLFSQ